MTGRALSRVALLVLAPVALAFVLQIQRFSIQNTIDPFIYVGYQQDPHDLIDRYGDLYFSVRVGLLWPAELFTRVFGVVPGYYLLRLLLAVLALGSLVALGRRWGSELAGWGAGLVCLASPVLVGALMTTYADTVGLPCLIAAFGLLLWPGDPGVRRLYGAGILFAIALHANVFTVLPVAGAVVGLYAVLLVRGRRDRLMDLIRIGIAVAVTTCAAMGVFWLRFGTPDLLGPSLDAAAVYSGADGDDFRQNHLGWLDYSPHLYIPVLIALALAALLLTRPTEEPSEDRPPTAEALAMLVGVLLAYGAHEFVLGGNSVETYFYFSYTFAFSMIGLVLVLVELSRRCRTAPAVVAGVVAVVAPALQAVALPDLQLRALVAVPVLGLAVTGLFVAVRRRPRLAAAAAGVLALGVGALAFGPPLDVEQPADSPERFDPRYEDMLFSEDQSGIDEYVAATRLVDVVPKWRDDPGTTIYWYDGASQVLDSLQATAFWRAVTLQGWDDGSAPALGPAAVQRLADRTPRHLVVLAETEQDRLERLAALETVVRPTDQRSTSIRVGDAVVLVDVLTLDASPCDQQYRGRGLWLEYPGCEEQ